MHHIMKVTNHTVGGEGGTPKPALGETWKSIPHVRLMVFRDHGNNSCNITVIKHSSMVHNHTSTSLFFNIQAYNTGYIISADYFNIFNVNFLKHTSIPSSNAFSSSIFRLLAQLQVLWSTDREVSYLLLSLLIKHSFSLFGGRIHAKRLKLIWKDNEVVTTKAIVFPKWMLGWERSG